MIGDLFYDDALIISDLQECDGKVIIEQHKGFLRAQMGHKMMQ